MKKIPKFILGFFIAILLIYFLNTILFLKEDRGSTVSVISSQNNFNVQFDLSQLDNQNLKNLLTDLNVNNNIEEGFTFELDPISTVALSFSSPIVFNIKIGTKSASFEGNLDKPLLNNLFEIRKINVPQSSNLVIFTGKLHKLLSQKEYYPSALNSWIEENFESEEGEYLIIFNSTQEYSLLSPNKNINLSSLENLTIESDEQNSYKEEKVNDINFHLLQLGTKNTQERTIVFFNFNEWTVISSSRSASKDIINALSGNKNAINIPVKVSDKSTNYYLYFKNDDYPINNNFKKYILSTRDIPLNLESDAASNINLIKSLELSLMGTSISGLINLK